MTASETKRPMRETQALSALLAKLGTIHETIAQSDPKLARGQVWCLTCGRTERINAAHCLAHGWPKCCDHTMTIDSPEERARLAGQKE